MRRLAVLTCVLSLSPLVQADSPLGIGTWVQRRASAQDGALTLTVEEAGNGLKLTYHIVGPNAPEPIVMTLVTQLDGKDAPVVVNGTPSGQTMGIRRIDDRHTSTVVKLQGAEMGTYKSELSTDGKVLKVENMMAAPGGIGQATTSVEYWDKK